MSLRNRLLLALCVLLVGGGLIFYAVHNQTTASSAPLQQSGYPTTQQVNDLVASNGMQVKSYDSAAGFLIVTASLTDPTIASAKQVLQRDQTALWSHLTFASVIVQLYARDGSTSILSAQAELKQADANAIDWSNPGDLWDKYSSEFLNSNLK